MLHVSQAPQRGPDAASALPSCSLPLSDLVLEGPASEVRLDHPCVREEASRIASDGFAGIFQVAPAQEDYRVLAGGHTLLAIRHLVAFDQVVWDRSEQAYRPAADVFRKVHCQIAN
ncbi:MAG: hypothetical protein U0800_04130 [Isosphaeraceae bacterium]